MLRYFAVNFPSTPSGQVTWTQAGCWCISSRLDAFSQIEDKIIQLSRKYNFAEPLRTDFCAKHRNLETISGISKISTQVQLYAKVSNMLSSSFSFAFRTILAVYEMAVWEVINFHMLEWPQLLSLDRFLFDVLPYIFHMIDGFISLWSLCIYWANFPWDRYMINPNLKSKTKNRLWIQKMNISHILQSLLTVNWT